MNLPRRAQSRQTVIPPFDSAAPSIDCLGGVPTRSRTRVLHLTCSHHISVVGAAVIPYYIHHPTRSHFVNSRRYSYYCSDGLSTSTVYIRTYLFFLVFLEAVEARVGIGISFMRFSSKRGPSSCSDFADCIKVSKQKGEDAEAEQEP